MNLDKSIGISAVLHTLLLVLVIVGLPFLRKPLPVLDQPLVVSIANISDVSHAPKRKVQKKPEVEKKTEPKTQPKKELESVKEPKPEVKPELKPEPKKEEPKPEPKKPEPKPEPKKEEPKPEPKPKPTPKKEEPKPEKPKEQPKKTETKPAKPKKETPKESKDDFANSILKSLKTTEQADEAPEVKEEQPSPASTSDDISDKLSRSEMDMLKEQLSECWIVPVGAPNPETLVVTLRVEMNPDRTVRNADVIEKGAGQFGDIAAESALRAIYSPLCAPLKLPPNKYSEWKTFTLRFDPRQMVGF